MITGQGDERVAVAMMKEGALDYVMKDRSLLDVLPRVVKQALDGLAHSRKLFEVQTALSESQAQLLEVSEKERRRMGHDLHDGLGQHLTAAEFLCHALLEDVSKPEWKERQRHLISQTEELGRRLREATATTRSLARGLAPVKLDEEGLMSALSDLAARTSAIGVMHCAFRCSKLVLVKESLVATHLFRIAQEAVTNALKHSHARRIMLTLTQTRQLLSLEVKDDGRGFPRSQKPASSMGLEVMQHRAKVIHATLQVSSHPGSGVTISCQLPLLAYASSTQSSD